MNNKLLIGCCISFLIVSFTGCFRDNPPDVSYIEEPYECFLRVDSISVEKCWRAGDCFVMITPDSKGRNPYLQPSPKVITSKEEDTAIRSFYGDKAIYQGRQPYARLQMTGSVYNTVHMRAIDWRISDIDIIAINDWDDHILSGSSIKELFNIQFRFSDDLTVVPLTNFSYGSMMLSDYGIDADSFWFYGDELSIFPQLFLRDKQDMSKLDKATIEVRIKDDFGNEYSAVTK